VPIIVTDQILAGERFGKSPLFILGAGASAGIVPRLGQMARWFLDNDAPAALQPLAEKVSRGQASRSQTAEFFIEAQESDDKWEEFTSALLFNGIEIGDQRFEPLAQARPSRCHAELAKMVSTGHAWVVSVNFDGLMVRALQEPPDSDGSLFPIPRPGVALFTEDDVVRYFCSRMRQEREVHEVPLPFVAKLRGDSFYAQCRDARCPGASQKTPIDPTGADSTLRSGADPFLCPRCRQKTLRYFLSFPGETEKEREADDLLWSLRRFLGDRVSTIVLLGFSGEYDQYLLRFVFDWAWERGLLIVDVKLLDENKGNSAADYRALLFPSVHHLEASSSHSWGEAAYLPVYQDAGEFTTSLFSQLSQERPLDNCPEAPITGLVDQSALSGGLNGRPLWTSTKANRTALLKRHFPEDGDTWPVTQQAMEFLKRMSQWGLKEALLKGAGRGPRHTRGGHTIGAFATGMLWLDSLKQREAVPKEWICPVCRRWTAEVCADDNMAWGLTELLVGTGLLLHDMGHLPFSHLIQESLGQINWVHRSRMGEGVEQAILELRSKPGFGDDISAGLTKTWSFFAYMFHRMLGGKGQERADSASLWISALLAGRWGAPWLQAIVNSPVDADKADYLAFDKDYLSDLDVPVSARLQVGRETQWLRDFLCDQRVNHAGLLCLDGRSAVAAGDMWRERVFLYDRFYLSPVIRVGERIALEIIQQWAIRSVMTVAAAGSHSDDPWHAWSCNPEEPASNVVADPIRDKCRRVCSLLLDKTSKALTAANPDWELLKMLWQDLESQKASYDSPYIDFLEKCYDFLVACAEGNANYMDKASGWVTKFPLVFGREHYSEALELLRPLQHTHSTEVLIDLVRIPRVLASPMRWRRRYEESAGREADYSILVPDGPVGKWSATSKACVPLTDTTVASLERPYCRVLVIAPPDGARRKAELAWDRVYRALRAGGIALEEV